VNPPGWCKGCAHRVWDSDICDECMAAMDAEDEHPRRYAQPARSNVRIPYDPETDAF
jgi:hypothetical protein